MIPSLEGSSLTRMHVNHLPEASIPPAQLLSRALSQELEVGETEEGTALHTLHLMSSRSHSRAWAVTR